MDQLFQHQAVETVAFFWVHAYSHAVPTASACAWIAAVLRRGWGGSCSNRFNAIKASVSRYTAAIAVVAQSEGLREWIRVKSPLEVDDDRWPTSKDSKRTGKKTKVGYETKGEKNHLLWPKKCQKYVEKTHTHKKKNKLKNPPKKLLNLEDGIIFF